MELVKIEKITDIQKGDTIVITSNQYNNQPFKVEAVKVSQTDGTEIIINKRKNYFFNLGMYLAGTSWVKKCAKII